MRATQWGLIVGVALVCAACSSDPVATAPTVELSSTSSPVTTQPTTTAPPATEVTTTIDPRIAEVEAAVAEFREVQVAVSSNSEESIELLRPLLSGSLFETLESNLLKARAEGRQYSGDFVLRPVSSSFDNDDATHLSCGLDGVQVSDAEGNVVISPDEAAILREYVLRKAESGVWVIQEIVFAGSEKTACDL